MDNTTIAVHLSHDPHAPEGLHWWVVAIVHSELHSVFAETYEDAMWGLHEKLASPPTSAKPPVLN
jgi:hypothetical protein